MKNDSFLKVLNYIEEHIEDNITLDVLSNIAGYSIPQFYRLFKRVTGDTVAEYIQRRKMSKASIDLKESDQSISKIAYQYGYQSHDVFTRAFNRVYGITPNKYRQSDIILPSLKRLEIEREEETLRDHKIQFAVKVIDQIQIVGLETEAMTWDSNGMIERLWCDFLTRINEVESRITPTIMYGVCEDETVKEDHFFYMAGIAVKDFNHIPDGMVTRTIKQKKYFEACVPEEISTPDAYTATINYAKSLGYRIMKQDELEVYDEIFRDPDLYSFKLLVPIE